MESYARSLCDRIKKATDDYNKSSKYLDQFQNSDKYYAKIDNTLDDFMRVSYYLANFLINTPPKYKYSNGGTDGVDDGLMDVDEPITARPPKLEFEAENFTIKDLDLPVDIESDFDLNYFLFYGFLSYIKPAYYYIQEHDMIKYTKKESRKHNITRVLANLVQFLIFVRSFEEDDIEDIKTNVSSLLLHFNDFFDLKLDDNDNSGTSSLLELYHQDAALLTQFLLLYDSSTVHDSFEDFKENVFFILNSTALISKYDDYQAELDKRKAFINTALESSTTSDEFRKKVQEQLTLGEVKSSLFKLARTLTSKILNDVNSIDEWSLSVSYQSKNDAEILKETKIDYEQKISQLEDEIRERLMKEHQNEIQLLREELEKSRDENRLLKEQLRVTNDSNDMLKSKLEITLDAAQSGPTGPLTYQHFERDYPDLFKKMKINIAKITLSKCYGKIDEVTKENIGLKAELDKLKRDPEIKEEVKVEEPDEYVSYKYDQGPAPGYNNDYVARTSTALVTSGGSTSHGYGSMHGQPPPPPPPPVQQGPPPHYQHGPPAHFNPRYSNYDSGRTYPPPIPPQRYDTRGGYNNGYGSNHRPNKYNY